MMARTTPRVAVYTTPPEALIAKLLPHLPYSLPLIRRLRFTRFDGGITESARLLFVSASALEDGVPDPATGPGAGTETPFAAGYLDFSRGPETELWMYSSLESQQQQQQLNDGPETPGETGKTREERAEEATTCALALLAEVKRQQDAYFAPGSRQAGERVYPTLLIGNLGESLRLRLADPSTGGVVFATTGVYDKWVFAVEDLPHVELPAAGEEEWSWGPARVDDIPFMMSRTKIERKVRTMKLLPSTVLYSDGKPIAWAFLGPDSSLSSLHCEEPYRGKGIAKAVAVKILRDHLQDYGTESAGCGWADVDPDNTQSQGVCRSLRGRVKWQISWSRVDLDSSFG